MASHTLPFGKHKNIPLPDVPLSYLQWLLREVKLSYGLRAAVTDEVSRRSGTPPPALAPPKSPRCSDCRSASEPRYTWQQDRAGNRRIRAECAACGRFLTFAPEVAPFVEAADRTVSTTPVLDVLI